MIALLLALVALAFPLDLEQIKEIALRNNIDRVKSEIDLEKLEERIREVRGNVLPSVSFSARFTKWDPNYISSFVPQNKYTASITLSQTVFDKTLWAALRVASKDRELQELVVRDVENTILTEVEKLYWAILFKREVVKEKEESLRYWESYFNLVRERFSEGIVPKFEFLRARAQLREAEAQLIRARSDYEVSLNSLKTFLGITGDITVEGELKETSPPQEADHLSVERNTRLMVLKKTLEVSRERVNLRRSEYYPKLSLFLNYTAENIKDFKGDEEKIRHGYSVGLEMSMKILDGGRGPRIAQERLEEIRKVKELEFTRRQIENRLNSLLSELKSAREELLARKESLLAAEESLRYATQRYTEGVGSQVELLEARRNYEGAKVSYLRSIYNYNSLVADLKGLLGLQTLR